MPSETSSKLAFDFAAVVEKLIHPPVMNAPCHEGLLSIHGVPLPRHCAHETPAPFKSSCQPCTTAWSCARHETAVCAHRLCRLFVIVLFCFITIGIPHGCVCMYSPHS